MLNRIEVHHQQELNIQVQESESKSYFIELYPDTVQLDLKIRCLENTNAKFFVLNHTQEDCVLNIEMSLLKDAHCQMGVLDLQNSALHWKHFVQLEQEGADYEILTGQLCEPHVEKVCSMEVLHKAAHTNGIMKNFAVLLDDAQYEMVANGNIEKGCNEAQSHQATRVLTLGQGHKTKVIPLLLIDENDVKASHALTIGQPDAEQLYYLQSRGLSTKQAVGLLSVGYFLPVIDMVEDEEVKEKLREEMESKVGLYGRQ